MFLQPADVKLLKVFFCKTNLKEDSNEYLNVHQNFRTQGMFVSSYRIILPRIMLLGIILQEHYTWASFTSMCGNTQYSQEYF